MTTTKTIIAVRATRVAVVADGAQIEGFNDLAARITHLAVRGFASINFNLLGTTIAFTTRIWRDARYPTLYTPPSVGDIVVIVVVGNKDPLNPSVDHRCLEHRDSRLVTRRGGNRSFQISPPAPLPSLRYRSLCVRAPNCRRFPLREREKWREDDDE